MCPEGKLGLVVTGRGRFRARVTQVSLHRLCLTDIEESLPRIAYITAPKDKVLVALSHGNRTPQVWGGISAQADDVATLGPGHHVHARSEGACHWGAIWFPLQDFLDFSRALTGEPLRVPGGPSVWRSSPSARRELRRLHSAAIQGARARSAPLAEADATHGLEQQLIHASIECLSTDPVRTVPPATQLHRDIAVRFEELLQAQPNINLDVTEISAALGVSERLLRRSCEQQFAISPMAYIRFRKLQLAHHDLRYSTPDTLRVSDVALHYGFRNLGRFSATYRDLFGELPSLTLLHGPYGAKADLWSSHQTSGARGRRLS